MCAGDEQAYVSLSPTEAPEVQCGGRQQQIRQPMPLDEARKPQPRKKTQSKSAKAGLLMPVARLNSAMKRSGAAKRVGGSAPVYATAVLEYLVTELLEVAGNTTIKAKRKRISPEDISLAVRSDEDLSKLLRGFSCCTGDKLTNVSKALVPREPVQKKKAAA